MNGLGEVRALLTAFVGSPWRELHLRSDAWTLFLAKPGAGANPLRGPVATASLDDAVVVTAPHLGSFTARVMAGGRVAEGDVIGTLAVLDAEEDITAAVSGTVIEIAPGEAVLVQYGEPLASIAA